MLIVPKIFAFCIPKDNHILPLNFTCLCLLNQVQFYACEIVLGLQHMHSKCICYRDLKVQLLMKFIPSCFECVQLI